MSENERIFSGRISSANAIFRWSEWTVDAVRENLGKKRAKIYKGEVLSIKIRKGREN